MCTYPSNVPQHPAAGLMPSQMGALEGFSSSSSSSSRGQQGSSNVFPRGSSGGVGGGGESLAQWHGRALVNSVRATLYQQHKQAQMEQQRRPKQQQQQQKEDMQSWADDDRFRWD